MWAEQKIWYYKKTFRAPKRENKGYAFLSFDGVDYHSRVWLNGILLGRHEGMFGGPVFEVSAHLKEDENNELTVAVASANYGNPNYQSRSPGRCVKTWATAGGDGVEPFFTFGLWRDVRLDFVEKTHLERPFIRTKSILPDKSRATLVVETELFHGRHSLEYSLHRWDKHQLIDFSRPLAMAKASEIG